MHIVSLFATRYNLLTCHYGKRFVCNRQNKRWCHYALNDERYLQCM